MTRAGSKRIRWKAATLLWLAFLCFSGFGLHASALAESTGTDASLSASGPDSSGSSGEAEIMEEGIEEEIGIEEILLDPEEIAEFEALPEDTSSLLATDVVYHTPNEHS